MSRRGTRRDWPVAVLERATTAPDVAATQAVTLAGHQLAVVGAGNRSSAMWIGADPWVLTRVTHPRSGQPLAFGAGPAGEPADRPRLHLRAEGLLRTVWSGQLDGVDVRARCGQPPGAGEAAFSVTLGDHRVAVSGSTGWFRQRVVLRHDPALPVHQVVFLLVFARDVA